MTVEFTPGGGHEPLGFSTSPAAWRGFGRGPVKRSSRRVTGSWRVRVHCCMNVVSAATELERGPALEYGDVDAARERGTGVRGWPLGCESVQNPW
jgi:hypothetical protein